MIRIKNINIPDNKKIYIALTAIYGIGQSRALKICADANIDPNKKTYELTEEEVNKLRSETDKYVITGDLRREVEMNIKSKMEIGSYQGTRHKKGLPVRGQRTITNARTRKGKAKTIANKKK